MSIQLYRQFRDQILNFLDNLIEQFPKEADFVIAKIFIKDKIPVLEVVERFGNNVMKYRDQIMKNDEKFFMVNETLEQKAAAKGNGDYVSKLRELWQSKSLDNDDKETIWDWMRLFIMLYEKIEKSK